MKRISLRMPLMLGMAAIAGLAIGAASPAAQAAPAQQAMTCVWSNVGNSTLNAWNVASAVDTDKNVVYAYSGLDDKLNEVSKAEKVDFSAAKKIGDGKVTGISGSAPSLYGVTGAYRAKGADNDMSAVYWFGGATDSADGSGSNTITELKTKSGDWGRVNATGDNLLGNRYWSAAAYDPMADVIWIVGGIGTCKFTDVVNNKPCSAKSVATLYMKWDATTGAASLNSLGGANKSVYGHEMVYDSANKRMLIFGGTSDGNRGLDKIEALNLDADPTKAKFAAVTATGSSQLSFLGGAAYWAANKWMVVAGGASTDLFLAKENANSKTIGLNMADPAKAVWTDLKATANDRVGAAMEAVGNADFSGVVLTGGRAKLTANIVDATGVPATVKITRAVQGLTCTAVNVPTAGPTSGAATATSTGPRPTDEVRPTPPLIDTPEICEAIKSRVPNAVINEAVAAPDKVGGYGMPCNPNLAPGPNNPPRRYLGLRNPNNVYHPIFNSLVWKCSCP